MTSRKWLSICVLACATVGRAETKWISMQSPNFQVYSGAGERETRDTLRYFERVREFFLQLNSRAPAKPVPVYVVIFANDKDYAPYRFNQFATAYYQSGADRDYIVMGHAGEATAQIATHEYVHLIQQHAGLHFPPWLGEGLAELYSTFQTFGDKVIVGAVIPGRLQALNTERWVPLTTILAADHDSPYYNEKDKAGSLYNEGWALVHMLQLTPEYGTKIFTALAAIQSGTPSVQALETTYGKSIALIDKDLQSYVRGNQFRGLQYPVKLDAVKDAYPASPAPMFDVKLALANLTNRQGGDQEAQKRLEELKQEDPNRPEPWAALAYLAWRHNQLAEAEDNFAHAYTLGDHSSKLLWDYGRLAQNGHASESVKALADLVALEPENVDARIELAAGQLGARLAVQALLTLNGVTNVTPEQAPRLFTVMGFAQMDSGDFSGAGITAAKLAQYAKTDRDRAQAALLKDYSQQRATRAASTQSAANTAKQAETPGSAIKLAGVSSVSGSLVEFTCKGDQHSFVLQTADGKKTYLVDQPESVIIMGRAHETVPFKCGPQKAAQVTLEYAPATNKASGDGLVRTIHFEP